MNISLAVTKRKDFLTVRVLVAVPPYAPPFSKVMELKWTTVKKKEKVIWVLFQKLMGLCVNKIEENKTVVPYCSKIFP